MKLEGYKGKRVRLLHDLKTKGGTLFTQGSIMRVDATVGREKLNLSMRNPNPKNIFGPKRVAIWGVRYYEVEVVS